MTKLEVVDLVLKELRKAEEKFPGFPTDPVHAAAIVAEEAGELVQAALDHSYMREGSPMMKEASHVAAMGIRFLLSLRDMERRPSN